MKKAIKRITFCLIIAGFFWCGTLITDRQKLRNELIRLHVVANSDEEEDQRIKLQVRDAVNLSLSEALRDVSDMNQAKQWIKENLTWIQNVANEVLTQAGTTDKAVVSLCEEAFDKRKYDTFSLPAGIYHSLRIVIGNGEGKNWWCVVFPALCTPATTEAFEMAAVDAGFSDALSSSLAGEQEYEIRFFLLDAIGKLENIFFAD